MDELLWGCTLSLFRAAACLMGGRALDLHFSVSPLAADVYFLPSNVAMNVPHSLDGDSLTDYVQPTHLGGSSLRS